MADRDEYAKLKLLQTQRTSNLTNDVAFSSERLRNMVTKTEPVTPVSPVVVQLEGEDQPGLPLGVAKPVGFVQEAPVLVPELVSI